MTRICVTDEQHLSVIKRLRDLERRIVEGTLPFDSSMDAVQRISEADFAFPIWKTITIGTHKSSRALIATLKRDGFRVNGWADDIFSENEHPVAHKRTDINLVVVTGRDLGFTEATPLRDVLAAGKERGLSLCDAEDPLQLRREYEDQPDGERLVMAMGPVVDLGHSMILFLVVNERGALLLRVVIGKSKRMYPDDKFVFRSR